MVGVCPGHRGKCAGSCCAIAYLQGKEAQLVGGNAMGFLVLYGAIGGASENADPHIYGLVCQHGTIGVTGNGLVINAIQPALCVQAGGGRQQQ
ncbi:hypothetical protein F0L74_16815 [Chitinophaga agrisoli]|uniref:Uncharacterized protein n=1 Tax=Chitinophaga agrisoli TaxID=2607653 RepID=A0A5B2VQS9_9BACT|nr:hypothetical protein F0L74_16815 [Chitinophaga agrisoli]